MNKKFFIPFVFLLLVPMMIALDLDVGLDGSEDGIGVNFKYTVPINYSLVDQVNNSFYLGGFNSSDFVKIAGDTWRGNMDAGGNNLTNLDFLGVMGGIRINNTGVIRWRNSGDTAWLNTFDVVGNDIFIQGETAIVFRDVLTGVETARFDVDSKRLGIGKIPATSLDILGTLAKPIQFKSTDASGWSLLSIYDKDDYNWQFGIVSGNNFGIRDRTENTIPFKIFSTAPNDCISIDATGDVGIGTIEPQRKLDVAGHMVIGGQSATQSYAFYFADTDYPTGEMWMQFDGGLNFGESGVGTHMIIEEGGNVGIGIANPSQKFQVVGGNAAISGNIYVDDKIGNIGSLSNAHIQFSSTKKLILSTNGSNSVTIDGSGNLNITDGNLNVAGNITADVIFANSINISNSSFYFSDDENSSIRYSVENINSGSNATALITAMNDVGGVMGIGIASSNYILGNMSKPNVTGLYSRSMGETLFLNFFNRPFVWYINYLDDNDPDNLVEVMRLNNSGLSVVGDITSANVFISQYVFSHTDETIPVVAVNTWTNITFYQEDDFIKKGIGHIYDDATNQTFTINEDGVYYIEYDFDLVDGSPSASDIDLAGRVIYVNGTEIFGSAFETDITKQQIETELSHSLLAKLSIGDQIVFQFIADDEDVVLSTHGTFGDHPDSATIMIEKRAN